MTDEPHQRRCWDCGDVAEHSDSVTPWVLCGKCGSQDTRRTERNIEQTQWKRTEFTSIWFGPDIELIVVQNGRSYESWQWTARGWREPDDCDGADKWGWVETTSRDACEKAALIFYL